MHRSLVMPRFAVAMVGLLLSVWAGSAFAEQPFSMPPIPKLDEVAPETGQAAEKISLTEAVRRALVRNPTAVVAMQEIRRAEALLVQARAGSMPSLMANATLLRLDGDRLLTSPGTAATATAPAVPPSSRNISPKNQQSANLLLNVPLVAPRSWTIWSESSANLETSRASSEDIRRTLATSVARAYLLIISQKRQVDINARSVDTDRSHYDYTHTRFAGGVGNRGDEVRAAQQLAADQAPAHDRKSPCADSTEEHKAKIVTDFILILLRAGNDGGLVLSLAIPRDLGRNLPDTFNGEFSFIGAVAVVGLLCFSLVGRPSKEMGQLGIHHLCEILPHHFAHIQSNHLEHFLRLGLNFFEKGYDLWHTDFHSHGASPFFEMVFANPLLKEKRHFFDLNRFHTIDFTLPDR